jgi:RHS repeat-associated protein
VSVADVNPGTSVERDLCLSVSLAPGAASECGDLRLAHALPAVRTLNRARAPVLLYNSQHASPHPIVAAHVTLPSGPSGLSRVVATLKVNGTPRGQGVWKGSAWPDITGPVRIAVGYDAASDSTGPYRYTLEVRAHYGETMLADTARGELVVVNRRESVFGAGWWLAGLERLVMDPFGKPVLWVGGDGSTRRYTNAGGGNVWGAPSLDRPDSIKKTTTGWERILGGGVKVEFDATGRHVATVNRLTHRTEFRYDTAGRVQAVTMPQAATGQKFAFHYDGEGRLERAESPGLNGVPRITRLHRDGLRVDSITDPDTTRIRFGYADAARALVPTSRTNRMNVATHFRYDPGGRVASSRLDLSATDSIVMRLRALESTGLATGTGTGATDTARAYALIDGPRTDAGDSTRLWLDGWGAPRRIINALGHETVLTRADARFPALVTRMDAPGGAGARLVTVASYDARGNADTITVLSPYGDAQNAKTTYAYENTAWPDFATRVTLPTGEVTRMHYDSAGNRTWQQTGPDSTRVHFSYGTDGQMDSTWTALSKSAADPAQHAPAQRIGYDPVLGNVSEVVSPLGGRTYYLSDALGRVIRTRTPIDGTRVQTDTVIYDAAGRVERTVSYGPPVPFERAFGSSALSSDDETPPQRLHVRNFYNAEGLPDSVARWSEPDSNAMHVVTTAWRYDALGRRVAEVAPGAGPHTYTTTQKICTTPNAEECETVTSDTTVWIEHRDSTRYDASGNVVEVVTRRGHRITMEYDALNRLLHRRLPSAVYGAEGQSSSMYGWHFPLFVPDASGARNAVNSGGVGLTVAADVESYTYDAAGNLLTADNHDAHVARSYYPNGALRTDTLRIRHYVGSGYHSYGLSYRYDLSGRRTELQHPANIAPRTNEYDEDGNVSGQVVHDTQRYAYHPETGALKTVTGVMLDRHVYEYDAEGRLSALTRAGVEEVRRYDREGRLRFRGEGFRYRATVGTQDHRPIHEDSLVYDERGKVVEAISLADRTRNAYSGLGMLARSHQAFHGAASGNFVATEETHMNDAMGNVLMSTRAQHDARYPMEEVVPLLLLPRYESRTGRQKQTERAVGAPESLLVREGDQTTYDEAGNRQMYRRALLVNSPYERCHRQGGGKYCESSLGAVLAEVMIHYYGADQKLRVLDRRTCLLFDAGCDRKRPPAPEDWPAFEEYRYDALGRRVMVRTRREWSCAGNCSSTLRRTVWDGDQVLYEISAPGATRASPEQMEADTGHRSDFRSTHFPFGRVAYTHGGGIDQPLALTRMEYSDSMPTPTTIVPMATWKGSYDTGHFANAPQCLVLSSTATKELVPIEPDYPANVYDRAEPSPTPEGSWQHCMTPEWPAPYLWATHLTRPASVLGPRSWMGSLIDGQRDASGQMYMRNRYYDPQSGRFTQEDPIGLAGGVNLYGFANGDPVSYSDPYGLSACPTPPVCPLPGGGLVPLPTPGMMSDAGDAFVAVYKAARPYLFTSLGTALVVLANAVGGDQGTPEDILMPGGSPIGEAGSTPEIREVPGGVKEAEDMFDELSKGGTVVPGNYPGTRVALPGGGTVGIRTKMTNSPGTAANIDVNIPGVPIDKIKFNP